MASRKKICLKLNDEGLEVVEAQRGLRRNGSAIRANGIYTIGMVSAVKSFQAKHGLPVTGIIDQKTWDALQAPAKKVKMGGKKK